MLQGRSRYAVMTGIFLLAMLGVRQIVTAVVDLGFWPWVALMGLILWGGIWLENRQRAIDERPAYSFAEARELLIPLGALAAVLAVAFASR